MKRSSPDADAAAAIAAPVTEATALAAATVSGSRLPRESGAPRGRGAPDKEKRRATVILGPTVDSERHLWCVGVAKVRLLHTL